MADSTLAIATKQAISGMDPFDHFDIPADWRRTYPATAKGVPSAQPYTAESAAALATAFIDPALTKSSNRGTWDPQNLRWNAPPRVTSTSPADPRQRWFASAAGRRVVPASLR